VTISFFQPHLHAQEGHFRGPAFLVHQSGKFRLRADEGEDFRYALVGSGNGAVDPFGSQQQRALDAVLTGHGIELGAKALEARETREMIKCGDAEGAALFMARGLEIVGHGGGILPWPLQCNDFRVSVRTSNSVRFGVSRR